MVAADFTAADAFSSACSSWLLMDSDSFNSLFTLSTNSIRVLSDSANLACNSAKAKVDSQSNTY